MKRALLWGIQFYRSAISPYKGGPRCRYTPTCSQYAQTAIERYGAVKGRGWRHGASCAAIRSPKAAMIPCPKTPVPH